MRLTKIKSAIAILVAASLTGCAVSQSDVNHAYDATNAEATRAMGNGPESMSLVEEVPTAFLGDRLVPVAYEATLPAIFREKSVVFPGNLPLSKIATLVSTATGYPVHLSPDVFIPRDALIPKTNGGNGQSAPMQPQALAKSNVEPVYAQACNCKVGEYLRGVTENLGLDWTFDGSTISISRFVTKTFTIAAIPGKVSIKSTMSKGTDTSTGNQASGGTTGGTSGNTGSFSSITSTGRDGTFDQIAIIQSELEKLKSPLGEVVVNPQSRLVMVRDTKEARRSHGRAARARERNFDASGRAARPHAAGGSEQFVASGRQRRHRFQSHLGRTEALFDHGGFAYLVGNSDWRHCRPVGLEARLADGRHQRDHQRPQRLRKDGTGQHPDEADVERPAGVHRIIRDERVFGSHHAERWLDRR
ncbi:hypothetical protein BSFA1_78430 (plasmid) [Burkholderia sp. SFA1]|nr:hypothetical protein BSFA1_78430 [Burkholderia sp. SFA1]